MKATELGLSDLAMTLGPSGVEVCHTAIRDLTRLRSRCEAAEAEVAKWREHTQEESRSKAFEVNRRLAAEARSKRLEAAARALLECEEVGRPSKVGETAKGTGFIRHYVKAQIDALRAALEETP